VYICRRCRCLQIDRDEIESLRQARLLEEEKAQYSVRRVVSVHLSVVEQSYVTKCWGQVA